MKVSDPKSIKYMSLINRVDCLAILIEQHEIILKSITKIVDASIGILDYDRAKEMARTGVRVQKEIDALKTSYKDITEEVVLMF